MGMKFIASMPMYDQPQERGTLDATWIQVRDALRQNGVPAPDALVRRNADLPPVPGGIRDAVGRLVAPDPASLPPDELDLSVVWRHPALLFGETCWGPLQHGLGDFVHVVEQNSYEGLTGGQGIFYRSALLVARGNYNACDASPTSHVNIVQAMTGRHFMFNDHVSQSGYLSVVRDLQRQGASLEVCSGTTMTGSHLASMMHIVNGSADIAAIDCRTWAMLRRADPIAADRLRVIGWTTPSIGLPFVCSRHIRSALRRTVAKVAQTIMPTIRYDYYV